MCFQTAAHITCTHVGAILRRSFLRLLVVVSVISGATVVAAENVSQRSGSGHGVVTGRVLNAQSGDYLENARITIDGTEAQALTDNLGRYTLTGVPAGSATLRAFHTGLQVQSSQVTVREKETVQLNFELKGLGSGSAGERDVVTLSKLVVSESREMDGAAIAINEKRFAANIKNVVAANEFGPLPDGNLGEILKFIPGVDIIYSGGAAVQAQLGGVGGTNTPITVNGFAQAGATRGTERVTDFTTMSSHNISRVEVLHTPTPESSGNALAGSINVVSKGAFERAKPAFDWSTYFSMRDNTRDFDKTPGPGREMTRKVDPGYNFSLIYPVNQRFGFTLSGARSTDSISSDNIRLWWAGTTDVTNGGTLPDTTFDKPYLIRAQINDFPRQTIRTSLGATFDFKLSERDRISLSMQSALHRGIFRSHRLDFLVNRVAPGNFSPFHTHGFTGAGEVRIENGTQRDNATFTHSPTLTYSHDGPVWKANAGIGYSRSRHHERDIDKGFFMTALYRRTGVTIDFDDNFYLRPGRITVRDGATGAMIDPNNLNNYSINEARGRINDTYDMMRSAYGNLARTMDWKLSIKLKAGFEITQQDRDLRDMTTIYRFVGADGRQSTAPAGNDDGAAVVLDELFSQRVAPYGFGRVQWPSNDKLWDLYRSSPGNFTSDENAAYQSQITGSKRAEETISATYLRADFSLLKRLHFVGGLRVEQTNIDAEGPLTDATRNFRRDASGNVIVGANGSPTLITTVPLEISKLTRIDRGSVAKKEYLRYFPNVNLSYNIRDNLIARAAYYHSVGRPNFNQYAGGITLPDVESQASASNRITVNNVGIKAWAARSTYLSLEYYLEPVGLLSVSGFRRELENFFGSTVFTPSNEFLQLYGLDPVVYGDYQVSTQYNLPTPLRMEGMDFSYKQNLTWLPHWARGVQVFANMTSMRAIGAEDARLNFRDFIPRVYSGGFRLTRNKWEFRLNGNYRGEARREKIAAGRSRDNQTFAWGSKRMYVDVSGSYKVMRNLSLFFSLRNVGNATQDFQVYGPSTPEVARFNQREDFGSVWTFGMKGGF
jgi:iron complex outermembrane receptor protein